MPASPLQRGEPHLREALDPGIGSGALGAPHARRHAARAQRRRARSWRFFRRLPHTAMSHQLPC